MSSIIGNQIKVSVFGQSHSPAIGVTIDGLRAGEQIDFEELEKFMQRRAPGQNRFSTQRREADRPRFLSGLLGNTTCGAPLTAVIENTNTRSADYENLKDVPRPGHADYTAQLRYQGAQDVAGGGHFSGRLTAPLCVAGGICLQQLKKKGIEISAHIAQIAGISDDLVDPCAEHAGAYYVGDKEFPVLNDAQGAKMQEAIEEARMDGDSVGGIVECIITGMLAGIGDPMFDGMENQLAKALFGIPAVKGLEFGEGFACTKLKGSANNDPFYVDANQNIRTKTNRHGGILGGITSGMPIVFRLAIKPTPSIAKQQESVRMSNKTQEVLSIVGRHDPCIVQRAVPVVEAVAAIVMYDALMTA